MRVRLKGLNRVTKRLADGTVKTFHYAWKGGPALRGAPGTPEFIASYNEAVARKVAPRAGTMMAILQAFQASDDFTSLADRTRRDYKGQIMLIEKAFGDFPLKALTDKRARGEFMAWRDELSAKSRRQADYGWVVLARVLSWALDRGLVDANPCEKGGRLYHGSRADKVWSAEDEAAFLAKAPKQLHLPLLLALWTGQRQGDLLRLPWSAYDGAKIRLKQGKTGVRVVIPVGAPLKAALDAATRHSPVILTNSDNKPWQPDGFRTAWKRACKAAGVVGLTFHDLRGTAVTRLSLAECSVPEIVAITGHSLKDVDAILGKHYLNRDPVLAEQAIAKLEKRTKGQQKGTQDPE